MIELAAIIIAAFVAWLVGTRNGRKAVKTETALEAAERYAKTTERMQDAKTAMGDDPAVLRDSLRNRNPDKP